MRAILATGVAMMAMTGSGCVIPIATVYRHAPDPRQRELVVVTGVTGLTLELADGRRVKPAGVNEAVLTEPQRAALEAYVRRTMTGRKVLVTDQSSGRPIVQELGRDPRVPWEGFPTVVLIPLFVDCPPVRVQVFAGPVREGMTRASPEQLADSKLAGELADAERTAREGHVGIWERPEDRLQRQFLKPAEYGEVARLEAYLSAMPRPRDPKVLAEGLHAALHCPDPAPAGVLLLAGADPNAMYRDEPPILTAVRRGRTGGVEVLLRHGANVNDDRGSDTPLTAAAACQSFEMVQFLLGHGAAVNALNRGGNAPLHNACYRPEIVAALLAGGAKPDLRNRRGATPLHLARDVKIIRWLIEAGADVNARDDDGRTPLWHYQQGPAGKEAAKFLAEHGGK